MHTIQEWITERLTDLGLINDAANQLDNIIVLLLIILITVAIDYICRYIFLGMFKNWQKERKINGTI